MRNIVGKFSPIKDCLIDWSHTENVHKIFSTFYVTEAEWAIFLKLQNDRVFDTFIPSVLNNLEELNNIEYSFTIEEKELLTNLDDRIHIPLSVLVLGLPSEEKRVYQKVVPNLSKIVNNLLFNSQSMGQNISSLVGEIFQEKDKTFEILDYLAQNSYTDEWKYYMPFSSEKNNAIPWAIQQNNLELVQFFQSFPSCKMPLHPCMLVAKYGDLEMLQYFYYQLRQPLQETNMLESNDMFDILVNMFQSLKPREKITDLLAKRGKLDMIQFAWNERCLIDHVTFSNAITSGNLELVTWLYNKHCEYIPNDKAAQSNHLEMVNLLLELGLACKFSCQAELKNEKDLKNHQAIRELLSDSFNIINACNSNHQECIQWYLNKNLNIDDRIKNKMCLSAAAGQHLHLLKQFKEQNYEITIENLIPILYNNNKQILKDFKTIQDFPEWKFEEKETQELFELLFKTECFESIEYLLENYEFIPQDFSKVANPLEKCLKHQAWTCFYELHKLSLPLNYSCWKIVQEMDENEKKHELKTFLETHNCPQEKIDYNSCAEYRDEDNE